MSWKSLGTLKISDYEWVKLFPTLHYGEGNDVSLFRVRHDWNGSQAPRGKLWFGSWFETEQTRALNRPLYPYKGDWALIESPVPLSYMEAGLTDRTIIIKPHNYAAWFADGNWTVEIEYFERGKPSPQIEMLDSLDELETGQESITDTLGDIQDLL